MTVLPVAVIIFQCLERVILNINPLTRPTSMKKQNKHHYGIIAVNWETGDFSASHAWPHFVPPDLSNFTGSCSSLAVPVPQTKQFSAIRSEVLLQFYYFAFGRFYLIKTIILAKKASSLWDLGKCHWRVKGGDWWGRIQCALSSSPLPSTRERWTF